MGRIVDGAVSGRVPDRPAFAINYPGYPTSVASAVETLGGDEGLAKARSSESNYLELKFRPDDPFAHPAFGELRHSSNLVLRLSKSRSAKRQATRTLVNSNSDFAENGEAGKSVNPIANSAEDDEAGRSGNGKEQSDVRGEGVEAEIIAKVEHTYSFEGMVDYQYVMAVHASASKTQKRKAAAEASIKDRSGLLDMEDNEMQMLVPPLFSVKDIPEELFLQQTGANNKNAKELPISQASAAEAQPQCFALDFKIKEVPRVGNWELKLVRGSEAWLRTAALVRLFQERPIWTRSMLNERLIDQGLQLTEYYLKTLLFRIAYYFGSGPFRNLWIRNGYDPRVDPESRAYQMIDFRVPAPLRGRDEMPSAQEGSSWSFSDLCAFKFRPRKIFTQFQMIDLQDDDIQAQIESPQERTVCSAVTGWFRASTVRKLRLIMRLRFLALFPGEVARAIEFAERANLERFKYEPDIELDARPSDGERTDVNLPPRLDTVPRESLNGIEDYGPNPISLQDQVVNFEGNEDEENEQDEEENMEEDLDQLDEGALIPREDEVDEEDELEDELDEELDDESEEELEEELDVDAELLQSAEGVQEVEKHTSGSEFPDPAGTIPKNYLQALLGKFDFDGNGDKPPSTLDFDDDGQFTIYEQDEDEDDD